MKMAEDGLILSLPQETIGLQGGQNIRSDTNYELSYALKL